MAFELPPLPYAYNALEPHIDEATMQFHHDKHHQAYVNNANAALEGTEWADTPVEEVLRNLGDLPADKQGPVRNNGGGHYNHSLFWESLSPDGGGAPSGDLGAAIDEAFGSFDKFKAQFTAVSTTIQGNGWGALSWDPIGKTLITQQLRDHHNNLVLATTPILLVDVWEHAFYLDYKNVKPKYVEALWNIFNWAEISKRFDNAVAGGNGLLLS
jgi:superoxide dismutase, Fe-Mn family